MFGWSDDDEEEEDQERELSPSHTKSSIVTPCATIVHFLSSMRDRDSFK